MSSDSSISSQAPTVAPKTVPKDRFTGCDRTIKIAAEVTSVVWASLTVYALYFGWQNKHELIRSDDSKEEFFTVIVSMTAFSALFGYIGKTYSRLESALSHQQSSKKEQ